LYAPQDITSATETVTFNPADFSLDTSQSFNGDGQNNGDVDDYTSCNPDSLNGNYLTCSWSNADSNPEFSMGDQTGSGNTSQGDSFDFTAVGVNPSALVTVTVTICYGHGRTAESSGTFPIAIVAGSGD
jgi:hypothetical protein